MPVKQIKRSAKSAAAKIRRNWTREEAATREVLAVEKQIQLLQTLGLIPVLAPTKA